MSANCSGCGVNFPTGTEGDSCFLCDGILMAIDIEMPIKQNPSTERDSSSTRVNCDGRDSNRPDFQEAKG